MAKKNAIVVASQKISKKEVEQFFKLNDERLSAQRNVDDLAKQLKPMKERFEAYVREHGGKTRTVIIHGCRVSIEMVEGSPQWKIEFVKLKGEKAAEKIKRLTPKKEALKIERV